MSKMFFAIVGRLTAALRVLFEGAPVQPVTDTPVPQDEGVAPEPREQGLAYWVDRLDGLQRIQADLKSGGDPWRIGRVEELIADAQTRTQRLALPVAHEPLALPSAS